jgi:hypothetical protein
MPRRTPVITALAFLACAACSSATEPEAPALSGETAVRAANLFAAFSQGPDGFVTSSSAPTDPRAAVSCPRGGSFRTTVVDDAGETVRGAVAFRGCGIADASGQLWTFTSLPTLALTVTPVITDSTLTADGSIIGALRIESVGVRGTCDIDTRVRIELRLTLPYTERVRQTGRICGQPVDSTWTTVAID